MYFPDLAVGIGHSSVEKFSIHAGTLNVASAWPIRLTSYQSSQTHLPSIQPFPTDSAHSDGEAEFSGDLSSPRLPITNDGQTTAAHNGYMRWDNSSPRLTAQSASSTGRKSKMPTLVVLFLTGSPITFGGAPCGSEEHSGWKTRRCTQGTRCLQCSAKLQEDCD